MWGLIVDFLKVKKKGGILVRIIMDMEGDLMGKINRVWFLFVRFC